MSLYITPHTNIRGSRNQLFSAPCVLHLLCVQGMCFARHLFCLPTNVFLLCRLLIITFVFLSCMQAVWISGTATHEVCWLHRTHVCPICCQSSSVCTRCGELSPLSRQRAITCVGLLCGLCSCRRCGYNKCKCRLAPTAVATLSHHSHHACTTSNHTWT